MFKDAEVGDRVWHIGYGWGQVVRIDEYSDYPLVCKFAIGTYSYTFDGKYHVTEVAPSLFWNEFKIPEEAYKKPLPKLEVDAKVIVWNDGKQDKHNRYFSHFSASGKICCFGEGTTGWSTETRPTHWDNYAVVGD